MDKVLRLVLVVDFEVTPSAEIFWDGIDDAERLIEEQIAFLLLQLSGDGHIILQDIKIITLPKPN